MTRDHSPTSPTFPAYIDSDTFLMDESEVDGSDVDLDKTRRRRRVSVCRSMSVVALPKAKPTLQDLYANMLKVKSDVELGKQGKYGSQRNIDNLEQTLTTALRHLEMQATEYGNIPILMLSSLLFWAEHSQPYSFITQGADAWLTSFLR